MQVLHGVALSFQNWYDVDTYQKYNGQGGAAIYVPVTLEKVKIVGLDNGVAYDMEKERLLVENFNS